MLACVCGSDLWFYRGISDLPHGSVGHEFIGVVDEVGDDVSDLAVGDFVLSPFSWSDGTCKNCEAGFHTACVHGGFFGQGGEGDGGQAEFVRVPQADGTLVKIPGTDFSDEVMASILALSDVMSTGYHAAVVAGVDEGADGRGRRRRCGRPVAACCRPRCSAPTASSCWEARPSRATQLAREWGATDIITARGDDAVKALHELTDGYGADAVLECVGTAEATATAFAVAKAGAIVGRVGVPHDARDRPAGHVLPQRRHAWRACSRSRIPAPTARGRPQRRHQPRQGLRPDHRPGRHRRGVRRHGRAARHQGDGQGQRARGVSR